jgi:predicted acetyltransferase
MISESKNIAEILPLFKKYMRHMSQYFEIEDYDSWFSSAMEYVSLYDKENDRHVYVLVNGGRYIGFAFINKHFRFIKNGFSLAEFYIDSDLVGMGYGRKLAEYVFSNYKGNWEVAVALKNTNARAFWRHLISTYTNGNYKELEKESYEGYGFIFSNA